MEKEISICGVCCSNCKDYPNNCKGCNSIKGKVYWAHYMGSDVCLIYNCCVNEKKMAHCGECLELPCNLYFDTRDPSISEELHKKEVLKRVEILKNQKMKP